MCADPAVLVFSTTSLQRKWQYLTEQIGLGKSEVLLQCPTYFSKALVSEVGPRHSYVMQHGLQRYLDCGQQQLQVQMASEASLPQNVQAQGRLDMQQQQQLAQPQEQQQWHQQLVIIQQQQQLSTALQQQAQADVRLHLGLLLEPSIPEFLALLGRADAADDFAAHAQHWAQTEGLKWTAARVT